MLFVKEVREAQLVLVLLDLFPINGVQKNAVVAGHLRFERLQLFPDLLGAQITFKRMIVDHIIGPTIDELIVFYRGFHGSGIINIYITHDRATGSVLSVLSRTNI